MCEYFLGVIYAPKVKQKLLSFANKYSKNHSQITHQLRKDTIPYEKKKRNPGKFLPNDELGYKM